MKTHQAPAGALTRLRGFGGTIGPMSLGLPSVMIRDASGSSGPREGALLLVCFPSAGLASTIVGHYVVQARKLPRIATIQSPMFPSAAVIIEGLPCPPVRIHGDAEVAVVLSEFPAPPPVMAPVAQSILQWADGRKLGLIVAVEGVLNRDGQSEGTTSDEPDVVGIPANEASRAVLQTAKVPILDEGIVGGTAADLLNEAVVRQRPLITLFAQSKTPDLPDNRAAAHLLEALDRISPTLKIDPGPLLAQAALLEQAIRAGLKLHKASSPKANLPPSEGGTPAGEDTMFG